MSSLLKTAEEVAEFIENLGIEYKFNCIHEKDPEGCYLLGQWFEQEKFDFKSAADIYKKGCDELNYSKCCDRLASFHFYGKAVEKDYTKARDYWIKGCYDTKGLTPRDPTLSCYHGGQMLAGANNETNDIKDIKPEPEKAIEMLDKACKLKLPQACQTLHEYFLFGEKSIPKDAKKALEYGLIGCDYSNYICCHNTYQMLSKGDVVPKDLDKAKELKAKIEEMNYQMSHEIRFGQYT
ncbi:cytochrome c oxidase assembly factor 7 [Tetranychus urticae]|uniref:cytochrome c oxidase assembly factor 7 n=1 Tax=Tetranychus urticae TaxID=32264 RepID=UPI00077BD9BB|nr:cytochrome c oxidase assembly factor 7 [Tetranychus urticae]